VEEREQAINGKVSSVRSLKHKQNKYCHESASGQVLNVFQYVFVMTLEEAMYLKSHYLCFESNGN
jgi:hypothetical protein